MGNKRWTYRLIASVSFMMLLTACENEVYHIYKDVNKSEWSKKDVLVFSIDSLPKESDYLFEIGLRTTRLYPYKSLWLIVESQFSTPYQLLSDTIEFHISGSNNRNALSGIHLRKTTYPLRQLFLHKGQTGIVRIRHHMIHECIPGINSIGLRIAPL